jgi:hypothetical protein
MFWNSGVVGSPRSGQLEGAEKLVRIHGNDGRCQTGAAKSI